MSNLGIKNKITADIIEIIPKIIKITRNHNKYSLVSSPIESLEYPMTNNTINRIYLIILINAAVHITIKTNSTKSIIIARIIRIVTPTKHDKIIIILIKNIYESHLIFLFKLLILAGILN